MRINSAEFGSIRMMKFVSIGALAGTTLGLSLSFCLAKLLGSLLQFGPWFDPLLGNWQQVSVAGAVIGGMAGVIFYYWRHSQLRIAGWLCIATGAVIILFSCGQTYTRIEGIHRIIGIYSPTAFPYADVLGRSLSLHDRMVLFQILHQPLMLPALLLVLLGFIFLLKRPAQQKSDDDIVKVQTNNYVYRPH